MNFREEIIMRIIAGSAGGRKLKSRNTSRVRPTQDRVREAIFNILAPEIPGTEVLDLFSGFGGLGLEALSRGAREAVFVERDRKNAGVIKENINRCGFSERVILRVEDVFSYLETTAETFDIIFMDPPYGKGLAVKAVQKIIKKKVLANRGLLVIEQHIDDDLQEYRTLNKYKEKIYGSTKITLLEEDRED
ncbi:MAG: 16S rRNA (guanine(966)-N(2))-methyltransferase RsmD [Halanaerobiales bacterium]